MLFRVEESQVIRETPLQRGVHLIFELTCIRIYGSLKTSLRFFTQNQLIYYDNSKCVISLLMLFKQIEIITCRLHNWITTWKPQSDSVQGKIEVGGAIKNISGQTLPLNRYRGLGAEGFCIEGSMYSRHLGWRHVGKAQRTRRVDVDRSGSPL